MPLLVEVWDKDKQKSQTTMIGATQLSLSNVLGSEKTRAVVGDGPLSTGGVTAVLML